MKIEGRSACVRVEARRERLRRRWNRNPLLGRKTGRGDKRHTGPVLAFRHAGWAIGKGSIYRESERQLAKRAEWGDDDVDFMGSMAGKGLVASSATHSCPGFGNPKSIGRR